MWICQSAAYFKFITSTHTHILIPFEDPGPTGLKVDIASIPRHDFSSSLFKTLSTADFQAWLWHQQCLMIRLCSWWSHTWQLGIQFCFTVGGCPCAFGDPRQLRHTLMWGSTVVVLVANLTFGVWSWSSFTGTPLSGFLLLLHPQRGWTRRSHCWWWFSDTCWLLMCTVFAHR